uniref:Uncharacterized protein n=1 Tax=Acrobeloides nanus TaxID=290746 RepID=A0A914CWC0_9BILA
MGYSHQPHEFFMECLKQRDKRVEPNFDAPMKMDFYQQALKDIEENKVHLAKWVQAIIIEETRDTVPARWFHKFMDPENAKIYDKSNDYQWNPHAKRVRLALVRGAPHAKRARLC